MGSSTLAIRIAGVLDNVLEFWAAELPQGGDGSFSRLIGYDHPALALKMIASAANYNNAFAQALTCVDHGDPAWLAEHTHEFITSMTLVAVARAEWHTDVWIARTIQRAGSSEHAHALALALAPRALYRVTVRDPAWLTHLKTGQEFGSTAYSPLPPVHRDATHALTTPGAWEPVLAVVRAPLPARMHLYRNALAGGRWLHDDEATRTVPSNRVRELLLRHSGAMFVYFDATAPRFNPAKFLFAERKPLPAPVVKMRMSGAAAGPRGFHFNHDAIVRHEDGVARARFDHLHPGNRIAWLEVEGEPWVRLGDLTKIDPESPSVAVDEYLEATGERVRLDLATP